MNTDLRLPTAISVTPGTYPYQHSLSSSASSSSSSVFSVDAASQSSESSSYSSKSGGSDRVTWDTEDPWRSSRCREEPPSTVKRVLPSLKTCEASVAPELRQNPRRCSIPAQRPPPTLVRQSERKGQFVECLVDSATQMVEVIWPLSVPHCPNETGRSGVLPLRTFIQETLRRSRTSFSTLQVALYYLILIKAHVPKFDFTMEQREDSPSSRALQCGRRMFLAALILASKYLQDRNYSARAWSRISGLKTEEINTNEMAFLKAVNWKLHVPESMFERWQDILIKYTSHQPPSTPGSSLLSMVYDWKTIVPRLTPALDTVDITPRKQFNLAQPEPRKVSPVTPRFLDLAGSNESTPTPQSPLTAIPPRFLEPSPNMLPPTPSLVRLGPLPTPILTPQSIASNTPAVSLAGYNSRRPSMCSAMSQAQNACMARSTMDSMNWSNNRSYNGLEAYHLSAARRPSVQSVSGCSLTSSPESMISDNSSASRSSRASSISSASSLSSATAWAPTSVKLNRLATLRCAGLPCPMPTSQPLPAHKEPEVDFFGSYSIKPLTAEPMSSPDMDELKLSDSEAPTVLPIRQRELPLRESPSKSRKRGRSSVDLSLQQNVRDFLGVGARSYLADPATCIVADRAAAEPSVFLRSPCPSGVTTPTCHQEYTAKAPQSPVRSVSERRLPIAKDLGRKRTCCASEAGSLMTFSGGPGMWSGIL